jgi:ATP-dependent helicase/nuclease subunit A
MIGEKIDPELNEEQKKAAFCTENAVVAAGAGSGKTLVLANRFAWLLTEKGYKVDEILTLTFTKKAAGQMFRRIHSMLSAIAANENGIKAERARQALDDFVHARIQTLDSYSTSLVRQCAPRYGISPGFEINPERSGEIAMEESLPFLIENRHHPAIERLYADNRPNDIARNIFTEIMCNYCRIDSPKNFTDDIKKQFDIVCAEWKNQVDKITSLIKEMEEQIHDNPDMCPGLVPVIEKYKRKKITPVKEGEIRKYFDLLLETEGESVVEKAESHQIQKMLADYLFFITEINEVKINKGKPKVNPVKENIKEIRALYGKFSSLVVYCMQAGFILSFMSLLNKLQERYLDRKRAEGILTFSDVANLSRTILIEQEDIRQSEKESFKAIMIDEFQDNNELQKDLLFLLAEKNELFTRGIPQADDLCQGKLFFVGDEKQSIYLFRGADVSVFRKLKNEIKSENLPLKINYRSVPALIGAFNAIFGGSDFDPHGKMSLHEKPSVFAPGLSQPLPLYEAAYAPLEAKNEGAGSLSVCILNKKEEDNFDEDDARLSDVENEARFVAERIDQLLKEKTEGGGQKYQPKDIAILFRSHSPQHLFEKQLRLLGIPYTSEDINDLFHSGLVNDIVSVLRLASHPLDSASYAEMLRSPFAGLSLSGTAVCLSIYRDAKNSAPFNDEPLAFLDEADTEKYRCGRKVYSSICKKAAEKNVSSLVSELWYNEGYRYETEWHPNTSVYREYFDYLYHLAVNADNANQGLAAFTDYICSLRDSGERLKDIEIPLDRPGAVHLLTIHKSKGLEYPVVFICCCGKHSRNQGKNVYNSDEAGIVFSPPLPAACCNISGVRKNFFWEQVSAEERQKRTAELRRLLYVAMTRAEEKLFLTGTLDIADAETDDFSLNIKNYIERKCEKNENDIYGDSILNNDTFFGLFLPAISSHIPTDGIGKKSFFNLEAIPVYAQENAKNTGLSNDQKGLNKFFKRADPFYQNAEIIKTDILFDNHRSPVSLRNREEDGAEAESLHLSDQAEISGRGFFINREFSGKKSDDVFEKVDSMLARYSQSEDDNSEKFNSGSFGTIAHICVEANLNGKEPVIPANIAGFLSPEEGDTFLDAGKELACRFVLSPLGKIAGSAELRESEFSFRSLVKNKAGKEIFISGTVDLFFEDTDSIHVVDFKTDSRESPGEHTAQMACYYHAVSALFAVPVKKECRTWLYYLRTGHAVEMTEKIKNFNLEQRAFQ